MPPITQTLRCEVIKPLNGDWSDLAALLRALRAPMHRVLNNTLTGLELDHAREVHPDLVEEGDAAHPRSLAYRLAGQMWTTERAAAADRIERGKPWNGDAAIAALEWASAVQLGTANLAHTRWKKWDKDRLMGDSSLPTFKGDAVICVAGQGIKVATKDGLFVLTANLRAGRGGTVPIVIRPYKGYGFAELARILEGTSKLGDLRLTEEKVQGVRKWQAFLSFTKEVTAQVGGRTMAIHRGIRRFLTAAIAGEGGKEAITVQLNDRHNGMVLETGADILAHKAAYRARRADLGRHGKSLGRGAKGHGEARRFERITRLEHQEENWVRTKCQEIAAHALRLAEKKGVTTILLEDWSNPAKEGAAELGEHLEYLVRSFPLAQLKEAIKWAAQKKGITVQERSTYYDSCRCPVCRHLHGRRADQVFRCEACRFEQDVDVVAAWNMLLNAGKESPHEDQKKALRRKRGQLRKQLETA